jgi:hypothetical protein
VPRDSRRTSNRWVDAAWWRDWVFWTAIVVGTVVLLRQAQGPAQPWWRYPYAWLASAAITTAVLGFGREVVRGYRGTERREEP